jgi:hypothetical protein
MSANERELVEQLHRQAAEEYLRQKQRGRAMVEAMFRAALEGERETKAHERALVEQVHRQAIEPLLGQPAPPPEPTTVAHTELPEAKPGSPLYHEWNTCRREVGRLLAEGHEGRFVLIKGEVILGIWETRAEAKAVALQKYLMQPCLIQQVRSREPLLRLSPRIRPCQS